MQLAQPKAEFGSIATNPTESVRPDLWPDYAWLPRLGTQGFGVMEVTHSARTFAYWPGTTSVVWGSGWAGLDADCYITTAQRVVNSMYAAGKFSVVFTVQPSGIGADHRIFGNFSTDGFVYVWMDAGGTGPTYAAAINGMPANVGENATPASATVTGTQPNTVAVVFDGALLSIYIDGQFHASAAHGTLPSPTTFLTFGKIDGLSPSFSGRWYDLSIYTRALTPAQIKDLSADPILPFRRAPQVSYFVAAAGLAIPIILNQARRRRT